MKVKDYVKNASYYYPDWDQKMAEELVAKFELNVKQRINKLSKGMLSMVTIIVALASKADFTFLDEPVAGLDVVMRDYFYRVLMEEYTKNLMAYQIPCAQILLNRSDFEDRRRYKNIFGSLSVLLGRGAIPIINENDTIAIEELKVGDNDTLSAQVAAMLHASLLILLTDIDGLYTANPKSDPNARHIDVVNEITPELTAAAGGAGSGNGTGGMTTKLSAASLATRAGVPVLICSSAEENNIVRAVKIGRAHV